VSAQALMIWLWGVVVMAWSTWLYVTPSPLLVFQLPDVRMHLTHAQIFQVRKCFRFDASLSSLRS
jgi:hypothetical protein